MSRKHYIEVEIICKNYHVDPDWLEELFENDLIEIVTQDQCPSIHEEQLAGLERMINLNQDLGVNIPGIEVILNLLKRIEKLEKQLNPNFQIDEFLISK